MAAWAKRLGDWLLDAITADWREPLGSDAERERSRSIRAAEAFRDSQQPLRDLIDSVPDTGRRERGSDASMTVGETGLFKGVPRAPERRGSVDTWCVSPSCLAYGEQVLAEHVHSFAVVRTGHESNYDSEE